MIGEFREPEMSLRIGAAFLVLFFFCSSLAPGFVPAAVSPQDGEDWPQWRGPRRDGVWRETGIRETFADGHIPLRWTVPVGGGYSGPTVTGGRVFVMDRPKKGIPSERVLCFDWKTGASLWTIRYACEYEGFSYEAGPRASVTVHDGFAYALGAAGHLHCIDAAKGTIVWISTDNELSFSATC